MAVFKEIKRERIFTNKTTLDQAVDIIQTSISGSSTRRTYQSFVTGGVGPGITSSLFQTVYDQDFTTDTANPIFDVTFGLYESSSAVQNTKLGQDSSGMLLFPSSSVMMREKVSVYRQFAQQLLGDSNSQFVTPVDSSTSTDKIDSAFFICYKRLFSRDQMKKETYAMKFFQTASTLVGGDTLIGPADSTGSHIYTDVGSSQNQQSTFGGQVGTLVDATNTARSVGLVFYNQGIVVLDMLKIMSGSQIASGTISAINAIGTQDITAGNPKAKFYPDFATSGSMDNILDHFCVTRFSSSSDTSITYQNITKINSSIITCELGPDEFNYSSNPTFTDTDNRIVVIDPGQEDNQQTFTFVTAIGLYDAKDNLLAVGKTSRPIEKNPEKGLSINLRLDY